MIRTELTSEEIARKAAHAGIAVRAVVPEEGKRGGSMNPRILLSCATVGTEHYEEALTELYDSIFG